MVVAVARKNRGFAEERASGNGNKSGHNVG